MWFNFFYHYVTSRKEGTQRNHVESKSRFNTWTVIIQY